MIEYFVILVDGTFKYTEEGLARFCPMFEEHGIDIGSVSSWDEHYHALEQCVSEALDELKNSADEKSIDREVLLAIMSSPNNERARALQRKKEVLERRAAFRLV